MRARDIVGKRIVKVKQTRFWNEHLQSFDVQFDSIELDNGTMVYFMCVETETEPACVTVVQKAGRIT